LRKCRTYNAQISAIMKSSLRERKLIQLHDSDLDNMGPSQRQAAMRGMQLAVELGYPLSPLERTLLARKFHQNTLHHYNVPNTAKPRTKFISKTRAHFTFYCVWDGNDFYGHLLFCFIGGITTSFGY